MKKLFLLESEFFLREALEKTLSKKGWKVYSFEGNEDCTYLLEDLKPDLALIGLRSLDSQEPSFYEFLKNPSSQIPVVGMGAEGDMELAHSFESSLIGFIEKPISPTKIEEQLLLFLKSE